MASPEETPPPPTDPEALKDLRMFLLDGWWEDATDLDEEGAFYDRAEKTVTKPALRMLCVALGHEITSDQCNKPEHDYCVWCGHLEAGPWRQET